jgi:DNA-directed RNA polymerase I subunit RPA49
MPAVLLRSRRGFTATAPGIDIPKEIAFHCYQAKVDAKAKAKQSKHAIDKGILLHTTAHRSLDYTAREDVASGSAPLVKHYVGVYDSRKGTLDVVEAKKMVFRGVVRAKQAPASAMGQKEVNQVWTPMVRRLLCRQRVDFSQTMMERRTDLGQTFGTKKAKKALREKVLNAILPRKKDGENSTEVDNASRAILNTVGEATKLMPTREQLQLIVDDAKPIPKPRLDAKEIQDVYVPEEIIGADILNLVPVREWQEKVQHKEGIQTCSRFVAARVNKVAGSDDTLTELRVLRYLSFVLAMFLNTQPGAQRGTRKLPAREKLREVLAPAPEAVVENLRRKFSDGGVMRKFHMDLLIAYCCVLACIVDDFAVDTQSLRDDLRLDQSTMNKYFHEIGGRVKPEKTGADGRSVHVARLALPLNFPKQRQMASRRK